MQQEDKEIRVSELLQILPVAVPVPKAACHFPVIRSRFVGWVVFLSPLFVLESSELFFTSGSKIFVLKGSALSPAEVADNKKKQSCFVEEGEKLRLVKFCHTGQECVL